MGTWSHNAGSIKAAVKANAELLVGKACHMRNRGHPKLVGDWFKIEKIKDLLAQWEVCLQSLLPQEAGVAGKTSGFKIGLDKICGPEANGKVNRQGCPPSPPRTPHMAATTADEVGEEQTTASGQAGVLSQEGTSYQSYSSQLCARPTPPSKAAYNKITCQWEK